jgi:cation diffusion facilitator CzcD-associated flavoprotein CzcO
MPMSNQHVAVAIVGGGPSGLTAAAALAPHVDGTVLVIEREAETGGIPRHSDHPGYGMRDLKRFLSGPAYARRLTETAQDAGAVLETEAMVTDWAGERSLQITSPRGIRTVTADAVVLATGARERPRPARLVPGDRPDGVYHRAVAEPGASASRTGRQARVGGRRRTGQLVGCVDIARIRLRHSRNGDQLPARRSLCGVSGTRPVLDGWADIHA